MSTIVLIQRQIRRALQAPLATLAAAEDPPVPIHWMGIPFARLPPEQMPRYFTVEVGYGPVIVHEMGAHPMMEGSGYVSTVIRTPIDQGEDANDKLLGIIAAAYPYASTPSFDGISVHVDKMQHRGYGSDGAWLTGLVSVDWNIYKRN